MNSLSVVIPCYNEENKIKETINKIKSYLKMKYEIIVVDDGSTDNTYEILKDITSIKILRNKTNRGKGNAVKMGMLAAKYDYALYTDADLSTPIEDLERFVHYKNYDIMIGSRKKANSKVIEAQPLFRILAGNIYPFIVYLLVIRGIKDTQCGFKLFNMKKCKNIFKMQKINGFSFDVELLYVAKKKKLKIKEVGVSWYNNSDTRLNFFNHTLEMLYELIKIRLNDFRGYYD